MHPIPMTLAVVVMMLARLLQSPTTLVLARPAAPIITVAQGGFQSPTRRAHQAVWRQTLALSKQHVAMMPVAKSVLRRVMAQTMLGQPHQSFSVVWTGYQSTIKLRQILAVMLLELARRALVAMTPAARSPSRLA